MSSELLHAFIASCRGLNAINRNSILHHSQGRSRNHILKEMANPKLHNLVQFRQVDEEERIRFRHDSFQVHRLLAPLHLSDRIGEETHRFTWFQAVDNSHFICGTVWCPLTKLFRYHLSTGQVLSFHFPARNSIIPMAPRYRGTPRRGRHQGQRGGAGGRGTQSPHRVSPLARVSPASNSSEDSGNSLRNAVQMAKFKYRRRTNRPFVSALITVIFEEEDEENASSEDQSAENSPNSSFSKGRKDSSNSPSSRSKLVDESSPAPTEEQDEALEEIVSILDSNELVPVQEQETGLQERVEPKPISPQPQSQPELPDFYYTNTLYPRQPSGMKLEDVSVGMEISWEPLDAFNLPSSENDK